MQQKKPCKPEPTSAPTERLVAHYNSQVEAHNAAVLRLDEKRRADVPLQRPASCDGDLIAIDEDGVPTYTDREGLIELIKRQNLRLGRHIKNRAHELLLHHVVDEDGRKLLKDGKYTVGYTYQQILEMLSDEFPECSTSAAALRWYVVHMRADADDQGLPWPPLPQVRPRSSAKAAS